MKYFLMLDEDNYIMGFEQRDDGIEFNPLSVDLGFLNAYKLVDNVPVLDEEKKAEIIAEREAEEEKRQEIPIKAEAFDILIGEAE